MNWIRSIALLYFSLAMLSSCELPADLDLVTLPPQLVVLANFSDLDTMEVVISKTKPALSEAEVEYISDAVVEIYINGFFADRLGFHPSPIPQIPGFYESSGIVPQSGQHFRLRATVPGFEDVEGESTMPWPVEIDTAFTSLLIEKEEGENENIVSITVKIKILDPGFAGNYYHLNFYQQLYDLSGDTLKTSFYSLPLVITSEDDDVPLTPYIESRGVLFSEDALEENQGELTSHATFQYHRNLQELGDFLIELRSVSPEYYFYHRSLANQYQSGQDPSAEPVILYTNILNGQGVFAGFISRFYRVDTAQ